MNDCYAAPGILPISDKTDDYTRRLLQCVVASGGGTNL